MTTIRKEVNHMAAKTFRPEELAEELGVSGKLIRAYLRANHTRPTEGTRLGPSTSSKEGP
jgi:hypothetical protein